MSKSRVNGKLVALLLFFSLIATLTAFTKRPNVDEGWFGNTIHTLVSSGYMGTPVIEQTSSPLTRINERTYWMPPAYFLSGSVFAILFGFDLVTIRMFSVVLALIALYSLYVIAKQTFKDDAAVYFSVLSLASSYFFIQASANVRMDLLCMSSMLAALAFYLTHREKNISKAILLGQCLVVVSAMSHPHGILSIIILQVLILTLDYSRVSAKHIGCSIGVYIVSLSAWGLYILQDTEAFVDQFFWNIQSRYAYAGFYDLARNEVVQRYLIPFGFVSESIAPKLKLYVLAIYIIAIINSIFYLNKCSNKLLRVYLFSALLVIMFLFVQGNKAPYYLISLVPFISLLTGYLYSTLSSNNLKTVAISLLVPFIGIQLFSSTNTIIRNYMSSSFLQLEQALITYQPESVFSSPELGYIFDFQGVVVDDPYLGYRSKKKADAIVIDSRYREMIAQAVAIDPGFATHVQQNLVNDDIIYKDQFYTLYSTGVTGSGL